MSVALVTPETAATLAEVSIALVSAAVVLAVLTVTGVALSTALHIHRSRAAIARHRFGVLHVRKRQ
jgi:hypothetical protein